MARLPRGEFEALLREAGVFPAPSGWVVTVERDAPVCVWLVTVQTVQEDEALAGSVDALLRDAAAAGWKVKLRDRGAGTYYEARYEVKVYRRWGDGAHYSREDDGRPSGHWYYQRRDEVHGGGRTLSEAITDLALGFAAYEAMPEEPNEDA